MLIAQLTDLHVRPPGVDANRVSETNAFTERACRVVADLSPQAGAVIITGDLTECGLPEEYANLSAILQRTLTAPVHVIPGNHDQRGNLRAVLRHLPGVTADPEFVQYVVEDLPVRLVMLDTLVPGRKHGAQSDAQLAWLDRVLSDQPSRPALIGMHHPPFRTGIPHMDRIALEQPERFAAVIARHRQVQRIVCGHHHRPIVGMVAHAIATVAPSVAHQVALTFDPDDKGAFNFEPPAFHLHLWEQNSGMITHTVYTSDYDGPFPFVAAAGPA